MHTSASLPQSHRPDHCALDSHRECVSLLPRVCELLAASGSCLPDDTSLEKLLDWFTQLSQNGTSLHENFPCLLEFISTVTHNTASDPAVICFMIKLTGVMASTVEGFQILQERLTVDEVFKVQRWQGAGLWEDPSVRSGWIHGLRNMMQHPGALSFFIQSEMMGHLFLLQTDSSLFVASSANQLLAHILLFYQPESPLTDIVMSTCDYLKQSLLPKEQKQLQQSARLLRLITQILSQAGAPLWDKVSEAVSGPLKDLVTTENSQLTVPLMEVILAANWYVNKIQVLHKCYQAVLKWTSVCTDLSWMSYQLRQDLLRVVQKRVCDLRWEVRDSTVEFLGQQAALAPSSSIPSQSLLLLDECSTLPLLREALQDQENYVRASAVSKLQEFFQLGSWVTDIVTKLLSILCEDTEGFSRRAVVQYFISWFSSSSSSPSLLMSSIPSILSHGSSDLDWEVKVHTLELATLLMDSTLAGHLTQPWHPYAAISQPTYNFSSQNSETNVEDSLSKLIEQGVISTLFSGFYDCDRPVGLKACQLLISLQETLKKSECTVKCSLPSWGWGQEIRALMGNLNGSDLVNVQEVLRCLNLEQRLCVLSQSSDHVQNSPLSLLQDILTARDVHSHAGTAEGQEIIVDCY
uniref:BRCA1-associated ATM activator 1 n=1 Tax=Periophthalmus magnuspinnatus TaxID=409849 RepID=A0A3B4AVI4_9GOBI